MDLVIRFPDNADRNQLLTWARETLTCGLRCPDNSIVSNCYKCPLHREHRVKDEFMCVRETSDVRSIVISHCLMSKCGTGKGTGTCQFSTPDGGCEFDYKCPADFEKP